MINKSSVVDFAFKQGVGIDPKIAIQILLNKGIKIEEIDEISKKLLDLVINDVEKKEIDDHYMVLFHLILSASVFKNSLQAYNDWIKGVAAEHNMKPEKYAKIIYRL